MVGHSEWERSPPTFYYSTPQHQPTRQMSLPCSQHHLAMQYAVEVSPDSSPSGSTRTPPTTPMCLKEEPLGALPPSSCSRSEDGNESRGGPLPAHQNQTHVHHNRLERHQLQAHRRPQRQDPPANCENSDCSDGGGGDVGRGSSCTPSPTAGGGILPPASEDTGTSKLQQHLHHHRSHYLLQAEECGGEVDGIHGVHSTGPYDSVDARDSVHAVSRHQELQDTRYRSQVAATAAAAVSASSPCSSSSVITAPTSASSGSTSSPSSTSSACSSSLVTRSGHGGELPDNMYSNNAGLDLASPGSSDNTGGGGGRTVFHHHHHEPPPATMATMTMNTPTSVTGVYVSSSRSSSAVMFPPVSYPQVNGCGGPGNTAGGCSSVTDHHLNQVVCTSPPSNLWSSGVAGQTVTGSSPSQAEDYTVSKGTSGGLSSLGQRFGQFSAGSQLTLGNSGSLNRANGLGTYPSYMTPDLTAWGSPYDPSATSAYQYGMQGVNPSLTRRASSGKNSYSMRLNRMKVVGL